MSELTLPSEVVVPSEVIEALADNGCCPNHDAEIRRRTLKEVESSMYHECFEVSHEEDGMQKWDAGNLFRYKLFEKVIAQLEGGAE